MTVEDMLELLKDLPPDMNIAIEIEKDRYMPCCITNSGIIDMIDLEDGEKESVLLLAPCSCTQTDCEIPLDDIHSEERMN